MKLQKSQFSNKGNPVKQNINNNNNVKKEHTKSLENVDNLISNKYLGSPQSEDGLKFEIQYNQTQPQGFNLLTPKIMPNSVQNTNRSVISVQENQRYNNYYKQNENLNNQIQNQNNPEQQKFKKINLQGRLHFKTHSSEYGSIQSTQQSDFFQTQPIQTFENRNRSSHYYYSDKFQQRNKQFMRITQTQNINQNQKIVQNNDKQLINNIFKQDDNRLEFLVEELKRKYEDDYDYYKHFKEETLIKQIMQYTGDNKISPFYSMIEHSYKQQFFPRKLGLLKKNGEPNTVVQAQHFNLNNKLSKVFQVGVEQFNQKIDKLYISDNNLSDENGKQIIKSLSTRTTVLDLSQNRLKLKSCQQLTILISSSNYNLRHLNLSKNGLQDHHLEQFLSTCVENVKENVLVYLNLNQNILTDKIAPFLKDFIIQSRELLELYISWNRVTHVGSQLIAQALQENQILKVLDISYNSIGGNKNLQGLKDWVKVFERDNKTMDLIHLDMSFNKFTKEECKILADGLFNNHSIYGFHFRGNHCNVDSKGFLKPYLFNQEVVSDGEWQIMAQINGIKTLNLKKSLQNCWICEGWEDKVLLWKPYISGNLDSEIILIHFSFDNFEPHQMEKVQNNYTFKKMCPPDQKIYYFYTIQGIQVYSREKNIQSEEVFQSNITIPYADANVPVQVKRMNFFMTQKNQKLFNQHNYSPNFDIKPRFFESINYLVPKEYIKIPWTFENSIFKDYRKDDEELLDKCFEKDWSDSKIDKVINPSQLDAVKSLLRAKYQMIKSAYKHYASISPSGEIWSIGQNVYTEIMNNSKIQNSNFGTSNTSLNFVNTNAGGQFRLQQSEINNNPTTSMIRYQFMEVLVRNINDKYVKTGQLQNFVDAWHQSLQDGLQEVFNQITDEQEWRDLQYWNENSDICVRRFKPLIDRLFTQYAGVKKKQIQKIKFMSFDDFRNFVSESNILGDHLGDRDINVSYNLSMMTQIEEISSSRYLQMNKVEFYEALARLADNLNLVPHGFQGEGEEEAWPLEQRMNLEICIKLEALLVLLHKKQDKFFKEENKIEAQSLFHEELVAIKNGKQITQKARKNVQQKVNAVIRRQSQAVQFTKRAASGANLMGFLGSLGAIKKQTGDTTINNNNKSLNIFQNRSEEKKISLNIFQNVIKEEHNDENHNQQPSSERALQSQINSMQFIKAVDIPKKNKAQNNNSMSEESVDNDQ